MHTPWEHYQAIVDVELDAAVADELAELAAERVPLRPRNTRERRHVAALAVNHYVTRRPSERAFVERQLEQLTVAWTSADSGGADTVCTRARIRAAIATAVRFPCPAE
jgi:hypothetical protein